MSNAEERIGSAETRIGANEAAIEAETTNRIAADNVLSSRIDSVSNQLDSVSGRVDKVGAGAAALASLHPLDYDADNKLSFASGVGNYAGSTAMAIGAFYRPNENCMMSLGGSLGNGENMVNLGVSFAIGKGKSPYASKAIMTKTIDNLQDENAQLKERMNEQDTRIAEQDAKIAELTAMVNELVKAKK